VVPTRPRPQRRRAELARGDALARQSRSLGRARRRRQQRADRLHASGCRHEAGDGSGIGGVGGSDGVGHCTRDRLEHALADAGAGQVRGRAVGERVPARLCELVTVRLVGSAGLKQACNRIDRRSIENKSGSRAPRSADGQAIQRRGGQESKDVEGRDPDHPHPLRRAPKGTSVGGQGQPVLTESERRNRRL
jgi:hypothetical protein